MTKHLQMQSVSMSSKSLKQKKKIDKTNKLLDTKDCTDKNKMKSFLV